MPAPSQPVMLPSISLCMIVRNEARNLPRCLASAQPYVDEMIVVDTGSTDETVAIAQQYGAKVSYFDWCDDFAAARNFSISQATGTWILILDADEELLVAAKDVFKHLGTEPDVFLYALLRIEADELSNLSEIYVDRLFRNLPNIGYSGCLHENIHPPQQYLNQAWIGYLPGLQIKHYGYDPAVLIAKAERNIRILETLQQQQGLDLRLLDTLAEMHEKAGNQNKALAYRQQAFERILPDLIEGNLSEQTGCVAGLLYTCGLTFLELEDYETLQLICQRGLEWFPNYPPLNYLVGLSLSSMGFDLGATSYFQHCLYLGQSGSYQKNIPFPRAFISSYPAYSLGTTYINLEKWQEANAAMHLALDFDPDYQLAKQKLDEITPHLPAESSQERD